MASLRPYQQEDVDAVIAAHAHHQCVLGRAATGLGKAVELAALAQHYAKSGRVMVLVDVTKLVRQLAGAINWFTGARPGIEMGDERASNGGFFSTADQVVVSTVQTQYSGEVGYERFRQFDPADFSALLLDECELFLAPAARAVVEWYRQNPALRVFGCTATPMRTDGVAMSDLFAHAAFDRDILWGIDQGWLVPARQAFVRVSLDFSTLKVRKTEEGERDYSEAEIAERINNEQTLVELAQGILHVAGDRRSIVVCPDVASAKAVAHYLDGQRDGCAQCVYGELGDTEKDDIMDAHQRGEFQFLTSVMMLTKGYDDPQVGAIFNCRKTRSKRLYTQILGRGTRPLKGILEGVDAAEDRRAAIAASDKPNMLMVNMVGVDDSVRDITIVDILGANATEQVRERAKRQMLEADGEQDVDAEIGRAEEAQRQDDERERQQRKLVQVQAHVDVEYQDDLRVGGGAFGDSPILSKHLRILRQNKVSEQVIAGLTQKDAKELASKITYRHKVGLCSYRQAEILRKHGYERAEVVRMTRADASTNIDVLARNGWRRPEDAMRKAREAWG